MMLMRPIRVVARLRGTWAGKKPPGSLALPLLALNRHRRRVGGCLFSEELRTSNGRCLRPAVNLKQTFGVVRQSAYITNQHRSGAAVMVQSEIAVDQLWRSIRREAESALARDPVFGAALSSAILDHPDFAHALAHQIGERLGKSPVDRERFAQLARDALAGAPDLIDAASRDL